ncbi:MAG: peptidylprolyl isomerase [Anaerolineae bacterium]|jgi:FKBP-type peptidyl-prolyl cis-trans isomerase SlyD|nr:peptidylprolyl isomerase [Anaerolineae bacterium]
MTDTIQKDKVVSLAYTLIVDGEVYEEWDAEDPFEYLHGAENVVPGLEAALQGRVAGDKLTVTVPPADGYGDYDAEDFQEFEKSELPDAEVGMPVMLEDEEGYLFEGLISEISGGKVKVDFNPPLAGKTLTYEVEVLAIRDADEEELAHGHAHGMAWSDEDWDDDEE